MNPSYNQTYALIGINSKSRYVPYLFQLHRSEITISGLVLDKYSEIIIVGSRVNMEGEIHPRILARHPTPQEKNRKCFKLCVLETIEMDQIDELRKK
jgi:hypothetical protein